jgi:hypothetical protein
LSIFGGFSTLTLDPELSKYIFTNQAWVHTYWQNLISLA